MCIHVHNHINVYTCTRSHDAAHMHIYARRKVHKCTCKATSAHTRKHMCMCACVVMQTCMWSSVRVHIHDAWSHSTAYANVCMAKCAHANPPLCPYMCAHTFMDAPIYNPSHMQTCTRSRYVHTAPVDTLLHIPMYAWMNMCI